MANANAQVDASQNGNPRRKVLAAAIGAILLETGFQSAEKAAVGTLVEIIQSLITEVGRSSKLYTEVAYRTAPIAPDVQLALSEMGISIDNLQSYAKKVTRIAISAPGQQLEIKQNSILQVGDKKQHPSHIPDHLPSFPDTHTYCFTQTYKQPVTEYEAIREKSAQQKRDIEKALTKFATKTNEVHNLFHCDDKEFLVMSPCLDGRAYVDALLPRDQVFEEEEEEEDDEDSSLSYFRLTRKKRHGGIDAADGEAEAETTEKDSKENIVNPFLRDVKMPKKKK